jgi:hypothetical protein
MAMRSATEPRFEIPSGLTRELVETLGLLDGVPPGVAEATIALLPYGSRTSLVVHEIISSVPDDAGEAGEIDITPDGWKVIAACARLVEDCDDTDEHPAVTRRGWEALLSRWRPKAEAADRELTRLKAQARERLHDLRSHPHTTH